MDVQRSLIRGFKLKDFELSHNAVAETSKKLFCEKSEVLI